MFPENWGQPGRFAYNYFPQLSILCEICNLNVHAQPLANIILILPFYMENDHMITKNKEVLLACRPRPRVVIKEFLKYMPAHPVPSCLRPHLGQFGSQSNREKGGPWRRRPWTWVGAYNLSCNQRTAESVTNSSQFRFVLFRGPFWHRLSRRYTVYRYKK